MRRDDDVGLCSQIWALMGSRRVLLAVAALASAGPPVDAGWDRGREAELGARVEEVPASRLVLSPGTTLAYRIRTQIFPPRIPLVSSGRPITLESCSEFYVLGLDAEGYQLRAKVTSTAEGRDLPVVPLEWGDFGLDDRGARLPAEPSADSVELANATQLFRDLGAQLPDGSGFRERKWFYFYDSGLRVPRMQVDISYTDCKVDEASGHLRYRMEIRETPEERARRQGFSAIGEMILDRRGRLVTIRAKGEVWKKVLFLRVAAPTTYEVDLLHSEDHPLGSVGRLDAFRASSRSAGAARIDPREIPTLPEAPPRYPEGE